MEELGVEPNAIVIPVGGGGLLAGMTTVIQHFKPNMEIIVSWSVTLLPNSALKLYTHEMYGSLQAVESEMCPSLTEAISAGKPVKALSNPTSIADCLLVPTVSLVILCTICSQGCI